MIKTLHSAFASVWFQRIDATDIRVLGVTLTRGTVEFGRRPTSSQVQTACISDTAKGVSFWTHPTSVQVQTAWVTETG